jgi:hypothetical protein
MDAISDESFIHPGFVTRKQFAKQINRCERTVKRLEDAGKVVVTKLGSHRLVDVEKTLARMRGEGKRRGRAA